MQHIYTKITSVQHRRYKYTPWRPVVCTRQHERWGGQLLMRMWWLRHPRALWDKQKLLQTLPHPKRHPIISHQFTWSKITHKLQPITEALHAFDSNQIPCWWLKRSGDHQFLFQNYTVGDMIKPFKSKFKTIYKNDVLERPYTTIFSWYEF